MSARERILERVGSARKGGVEPTPVEDYMRRHPRGPVPSVAPDRAARLSERAARLGSEVAAVEALSGVPAAVARYLDSHGLPRRAVCWPQVAALPWREHGLEIEARPARGDDIVGVTGVFAVIAETGTLMLLSGPQTPATVSLLPEVHVAVVRTEQIVPTMEDAWERLRAQAGAMPRAVNFVSGPSRTADVEQTVTLGAHGPRRVLIVLVAG